jgi:hypothetical protein
MRKATTQFAFTDFFPRAFGVLLSTAHAGSKILQAIHVQSTATVAWW